MRKRGFFEWVGLISIAIIEGAGWVGIYICMIGVLVLLTTDPIMRYLVGSPFFWSNEVSTFLMMLMAFFGFAVTLIRGKHVRVTLLFGNMPEQIQNYLWIFISLVGLIYSCFVTYGLFELAFSSLEYNAVTPTAEMPYFPWQLAAAIGMSSLVIAVVLFMIQRVKIALGIKQEKEIHQEL